MAKNLIILVLIIISSIPALAGSINCKIEALHFVLAVNLERDAFQNGKITQLNGHYNLKDDVNLVPADNPPADFNIENLMQFANDSTGLKMSLKWTSTKNTNGQTTTYTFNFDLPVDEDATLKIAEESGVDITSVDPVYNGRVDVRRYLNFTNIEVPISGKYFGKATCTSGSIK